MIDKSVVPVIMMYMIQINIIRMHAENVKALVII